MLGLIMCKSITEKILFICAPEFFLSLMRLELGLMRTRGLPSTRCRFPTQSPRLSTGLCRSKADLSLHAWLRSLCSIHSLSCFSMLDMMLCAERGRGISSVSVLVKSDRSNGNIHQGVIRQKEWKHSLFPFQRQDNKDPTFEDTSSRDVPLCPCATVLPTSNHPSVPAIPPSQTLKEEPIAYAAGRQCHRQMRSQHQCDPSAS